MHYHLGLRTGQYWDPSALERKYLKYQYESLQDIRGPASEAKELHPTLRLEPLNEGHIKYFVENLSEEDSKDLAEYLNRTERDWSHRISGDLLDPNDSTKPLEEGGTYEISREKAMERQAINFNTWDMIRVLTLLPGTFGDIIHSEISHVYIPHEQGGSYVNPLGEHPQYEAISYTWGNRDVKKEIFISGKRLKVRFNLWIALNYLRNPKEKRTLWIDAICINQENVNERNTQVLRMDQIYRESTGVLIWLGESTPETDRALDILEAAGGKESHMVERRMNDADYWMGLIPKDPECLIGPDEFSRDDWEALCHLFWGRSWWNRMWIIQEITYPPKARILCGKRSIPWDTLHNLFTVNQKFVEGLNAGSMKFVNASELFKEAVYLDIQRSQTQAATTLLAVGATRIHTRLRTLLDANSFRQCSDPRDMIYALLSLSSCPDSLTIDYSRSVEDVYIEAAKVIIHDVSNPGREPQPNLDIIHAAYRSPNPTKRKLPSWVPDWSISQEFNKIFNLNDGETPFNATKGLVPGRTFNINDDNELSFPAIYLDEISVVRPPLIGKMGERWDHKFWEPHGLDSLIYITGENSIDAFLRTLLTDEGDIVGRRLEDDELDLYRTEYLAWSGRRFPSASTSQPSWDSGVQKSLAFDNLYEKLHGQTFVSTSAGYFAIAPTITKVGDVVFCARGSSAPLILRQLENEANAEPLYTLIGPAYVHGIMDGEVVEALKQGLVSEKQIRIA